MSKKPKQGGRMIWLDQIRRPIWRMSYFSVPTFGKHLLTLSCHFPFWQMSHTRRAGHPSDRLSTGLPLHQWCYRQWLRGTFFHFFYCNGISAGWNTRVISAHSWRFLWEPSDHWLFHGVKSWLAAEKEELNQSQCWKRGAILLKWKIAFNREKQSFSKVQVYFREKLTGQQTMPLFYYAEANLYNSLYHTYPYPVNYSGVLVREARQRSTTGKKMK